MIPIELLSTRNVTDALRRAWIESEPGGEAAHEEGGFILRDTAGTIRVSRWPRGTSSEIVVPPHSDYQYEGQAIIASFHTHPNTGRAFRQEPSTMDRWTIRDNSNLKGVDYIGEFVLSKDAVYLVDQRGQVTTVGTNTEMLGNTED